MEAAREHESTGLLDKILPPRLEDAGLEDCALPPDAIHEAFLKAADAVKSRASTLFQTSDDDDGECVTDPWPDVKDTDTVDGGAPTIPGPSDELVGISTGEDTSGPCVGGKVGKCVDRAAAEDAVVVGGDVKEVDGKGCIDDVLKGLKIKEKVNDDDDEDEDRESERPILVEGFL